MSPHFFPKLISLITHTVLNKHEHISTKEGEPGSSAGSSVYNISWRAMYPLDCSLDPPWPPPPQTGAGAKLQTEQVTVDFETL